MRVSLLRLHNFRNHAETLVEFGSGTNVLLGDNGRGKTNIIEALSCLCLTKSFFAANDAVLLKFGSEFYELEGTLTAESGYSWNVRFAYSQSERAKHYSIDRQQVERLTTVIGKFPVVVYSPDHAAITSGGPSDRRRFLDLVIAQSSSQYLGHLVEYRQIIRHRNRMLADWRAARLRDVESLEPWNEQLIVHGSAIIQRRLAFCREFQSYVSQAYHRLVGGEEEPSIAYQPLHRLDESQSDLPAIRNALAEELREQGDLEKRTGLSLVGPHRDELWFRINGCDLRKYASQGQHRTFLIALKIGEYFYLNDRCGERPILLLDDVFTELDPHRAGHLLEYVKELNQTVITSTNEHLFDHRLFDGVQSRIFSVRPGSVIEQQTQASA